jgi:hypothetical protein
MDDDEDVTPLDDTNPPVGESDELTGAGTEDLPQISDASDKPDLPGGSGSTIRLIDRATGDESVALAQYQQQLEQSIDPPGRDVAGDQERWLLDKIDQTPAFILSLVTGPIADEALEGSILGELTKSVGTTGGAAIALAFGLTGVGEELVIAGTVWAAFKLVTTTADNAAEKTVEILLDSPGSPLRLLLPPNPPANGLRFSSLTSGLYLNGNTSSFSKRQRTP